MYEHPSYIYSSIVVERERIDRANELRRSINEQPTRVVKTERPALTWLRGLFGHRSADAAPRDAAPSAACRQPAHVR